VTNAVATVRNISKLENLKSQGRSEIALGVLSGYEKLQKMVEEAIQIVGRSDILFSTLNSAKSAEPTRASMACSSFDTSDLTHNCKQKLKPSSTRTFPANSTSSVWCYLICELTDPALLQTLSRLVAA